MITYKNNLAIFLFMKLSYMMIGYIYFYFHPNVTALSLFTILYLAYVIYEMNNEIYSIKYAEDKLEIQTFLNLLLKKTTSFLKADVDLVYIRKKQDYAFNNNKIVINSKYRLSSMYWNKSKFDEILQDLGNL